MTKSDARPRQVTAALSFRVSDGGRMKKIDDDTRAGIVVESARRGVAGQKFVALQRKLMMLDGAEPKVHLLCADAAAGEIFGWAPAAEVTRCLEVGFGRIVVSEIEVPNILVNLVLSV